MHKKLSSFVWTTLHKMITVSEVPKQTVLACPHQIANKFKGPLHMWLIEVEVDCIAVFSVQQLQHMDWKLQCSKCNMRLCKRLECNLLLHQQHSQSISLLFHWDLHTADYQVVPGSTLRWFTCKHQTEANLTRAKKLRWRIPPSPPAALQPFLLYLITRCRRTIVSLALRQPPTLVYCSV